MSRFLVSLVVVSTLLMGAATAGAAPRLPERVFACHILNGAGETVIVHVQADSVERASIVAGEMHLPGESADESAAHVDVVECIERAGERFRDKEARRKVDSLLQ